MTLAFPKGKRRKRIKRDADAEASFEQPRLPVLRSEKWLDEVRNRPCVLTGASPAVAAHVRWRSNGGTALKPGDNRALPLTDDLHKLQHQVGEVSFWTEMFIKYPRFAAMCRNAWNAVNNPAKWVGDIDDSMEALTIWTEKQYDIWQRRGGKAPSWI